MHHYNKPAPLIWRSKALRILLFAIITFTLCISPLKTQNSKLNTNTAHAHEGPASAVWITPRGSKPFFVIGANYEGPTDRAWLMWEDGKFDRQLIADDFSRARWLGINTLRIFVQKPLRDDVNAGNFSKLDTVMELARQYNLRLILTFTDWAEPDLAKAGDLNALIAAHLSNEPSILAYDAKNEPQFSDVAAAIFPTGTVVPLQTPDFIAPYGERVSRSDTPAYRQGEGKAIIPTRMNDDQAYVLANAYKLFKEFLDAGAAWVNTHPNTTTLDYMDSPDSASWAPFLAALDATMAAWVNAQMDPVRRADPGRLITVGYSNIVLAKLPSNQGLDFQSVHRFTAHGYPGLNATFLVLSNLQRNFPQEAVLLEEFGYPGQVNAPGGGTQGFDPRTTANLESAIWAFLYSNGFAGGAKWMLNNFPQGANPAENSYGLFDNNNQPKLSAYALKQLAELFSRSSPGTLSSVRPDDNYAVSYAYQARDALIAGGKTYTGTNVIYSSSAPSQVVVGTSSGNVTLFATGPMTTDLNLPGIYGVSLSDLGRINVVGNDPNGQPWTPPVPVLVGDWLRLSVQPLYRYQVVAIPRALDQAAAQPDPGTVYFPQTGHNLGGDFLKYWQSHGGLPIFGYPLSEPFTERGITVQYFERNRFELHPENQPPYNVLLGRLGADQTSDRSFEQSQPFDATPGHRYFPETGHSLHFAFLGYWERNGGLAQFGFPISEETKEVNPVDGKEYTVQYFERARFEYHPEYKGTPAEVLLGLLGVTSLKNKGWLP